MTVVVRPSSSLGTYTLIDWISTGSSITLPSSSNTSLLAFVSNTSMISSSLRRSNTVPSSTTISPVSLLTIGSANF